jgi:hypothetical protein
MSIILIMISNFFPIPEYVKKKIVTLSQVSRGLRRQAHTYCTEFQYIFFLLRDCMEQTLYCDVGHSQISASDLARKRKSSEA